MRLETKCIDFIIFRAMLLICNFYVNGLDYIQNTLKLAA